MKKLFIALVFTGFCLNLASQTPFFSQYNSVPLWTNPGYAGSIGQGRAGFAFRDQWPKIQGNYLTTNFSYDQYFAKLHGGIGINVNDDRVNNGIFSSDRAEVIYAFRMELLGGTLALQPALSAGVIQTKVDWDQLVFSGPPEYGQNSNALDISSGIVGYTKRLTFGIAAHHINSPDIGVFGESRLKPVYTAHVSALLGDSSDEISTDWKFVPQVIYEFQDNYNYLNVGVSAVYGHFMIGAAYRTSNAIIGMVAVHGPYYRIGYSYDYGISDLDHNISTGGSHEITLQVFLFGKKKEEGKLFASRLPF